MIESTEFADELNVKFEREKWVKKEFFFFPEQQKECNYPSGERPCKVDLGAPIESLLMDILNVRCLLGIQVEMLKIWLNMNLKFRKEVQTGDKYQEIINE